MMNPHRIRVAARRVAQFDIGQRAYLDTISCNALLVDSCSDSQTPQRPSFIFPEVKCRAGCGEPCVFAEVSVDDEVLLAREHVGAHWHWHVPRTRQMSTPRIDILGYQSARLPSIPFPRALGSATPTKTLGSRHANDFASRYTGNRKFLLHVELTQRIDRLS